MVENLEVAEGDNLETANTFYIRDEHKSVELYTHTAEEKAAWLEALFKTMQEIMRRKASLKTAGTKSTLVTADDVTRCMVCEAIFSVMKRKHNCRACGIVRRILKYLSIIFEYPFFCFLFNDRIIRLVITLDNKFLGSLWQMFESEITFRGQ